MIATFTRIFGGLIVGLVLAGFGFWYQTDSLYLLWTAKEDACHGGEGCLMYFDRILGNVKATVFGMLAVGIGVIIFGEIAERKWFREYDTPVNKKEGGGKN